MTQRQLVSWLNTYGSDKSDLSAQPQACYLDDMSTLAEIEAAVESLPLEQKQELFLFLVARLRDTGHLPPPRDFRLEQIQAWIADDEEGMRLVREGA